MPNFILWTFCIYCLLFFALFLFIANFVNSVCWTILLLILHLTMAIHSANSKTWKWLIKKTQKKTGISWQIAPSYTTTKLRVNSNAVSVHYLILPCWSNSRIVRHIYVSCLHMYMSETAYLFCISISFDRNHRQMNKKWKKKMCHVLQNGGNHDFTDYFIIFELTS